jgi:hypothetical protein
LDFAPPPRLITVRPDELAGYEILITGGGQHTIGRNTDNDLRIDSPHLSGHHAILLREGGFLTIADLGSHAGTHVNGVRITEPTFLRHGDRIGLGLLEMALWAPGTTSPLPVSRQTSADTSSIYDITSQSGQLISNVGQNQYNTYQHQYALKITPMLARARALLSCGVALMLAGAALYLIAVVSVQQQEIKMAKAIFNSSRKDDFPAHMQGVSFSSLDLLPYAYACGFIGFTLVVIALMTRRRAHKEEKLL